MSKILDLKRVQRLPLGFRAGTVLQSIRFRPAQPATLDFGPAGSALGTCLRCPDQPCITFSPGESGIEIFAKFPAEPASVVCPAGAIAWPDNAETPIVESSLCVSCGICATRCPAGAIHLDADGLAVVNSRYSNQFIEEVDASRATSAHGTARQYLANAKRDGMLRDVTERSILEALERVNKIGPSLTPKFPTLLVRNLLRSLGVRAESRRIGDVNVRMDVVYSVGENLVGACEVEFAASTLLDTPRNILDNLAVLIARHGVPRESARGLIVGLALPNERSEFWQVIIDIRTVLGVEIAVATVPALYMLVWSLSRLSADGIASMSVKPGTRSIRTGIETVLGRALTLSPGAGAVLESSK